jgi:tetratricopeptide (TPR) repeat protein
VEADGVGSVQRHVGWCEPLRASTTVLVLLAAGCSSRPAVRLETTQPPGAPPQGTSLIGRPLAAIPRGADPAAERELAQALEERRARPDDPDALIWVGRRHAYLWGMRAAVEVFGEGVAQYPHDPRFLRHRGHRLISLRKFAEAEADLARAARLIEQRPELGAEVEPDGQPNARNIPLTTTGFNVYYHLALARYYQHNFEGALEAWTKAEGHTRGLDDNIVAVAYWKYLTLRRLGRDREARQTLEVVREGMDIIENHAYHALTLMYKEGEPAVRAAMRSPPGGTLDRATVLAGVGHYLLLAGDRASAETCYRTVIDGGNWPAFGYIAAEVELAAMERSRAGM